MKSLLIILFIGTLGIISKQQDTNIQYSKKLKTSVDRSIKIINARKFQRLHPLKYRKLPTKKAERISTYTVFPPIAQKKLLDVPETNIFQDDINVVRKPRVKKVLPEYGLSVFRSKRSVDNTDDDDVNVTNGGRVNKKVRKNRQNGEKSVKRKKTRSSGASKGNVSYVIKKRKRLNATKVKDLIQSNEKSTINLKYTRKVKKAKRLRSENKASRVNKTKRVKRLRTKRQKKEVGGRRLIAGRDALIQDYPYVVSIQKGNEHWCAGALLNQRLVITTANCVWKAQSVSRMRVRAGSRNMDRGGQVAKIAEVVKHPDWNIRSQPDNDIGLLLLDRNIKFSDTVHGVDLPNRAMWPAFEDVWVTSWGSDRRDGIFKTTDVTLQVYHATLLDHDKCNNITQRFGVIVTNNFICVAQTGRRAPCTRDTGAPAVSDGILWGLASWGIRKLCGTERFPAMFSYTASRSNLDFITNATLHLMSDKRFNPYPDQFVINQANAAAPY